MQLPLEGIQACDCGFEKARLDDANVDSKVVQISPEKKQITLINYDYVRRPLCINSRT